MELHCRGIALADSDPNAKDELILSEFGARVRTEFRC